MTRAEINRHITKQVGNWARGYSVDGTIAGANDGFQYTLSQIRRMAQPGQTYFLNRFHNRHCYSNDSIDLVIPNE